MEARLISTGIQEMLPMARTGEPNRHVSAIVRSLCLRLGHFDDDSDVSDETIISQRQTRWELGSSFESAVIRALAARYASAYPDRYLLIGELEKDGIIGTPDLVDLVLTAVVEIKLTWISSRHDIESEKFWKYLVQLMAYCYMFETYTGLLHVCHVNGNYRGDRGPTYRAWQIDFTQVELFENWRMLKLHQRGMVAA